MRDNLSVIILSAGKGTRMKSTISKPLHKIGNLEMINHVINTAKQMNTDEIVVVVSEENKEQIDKNISDTIKTVVQYDRNGTGGATKVGFGEIKNKNNKILVMYGDVPLIRLETYQDMINKVNDDVAVAVLGFNTGDVRNKYGRLVLDGKNKLTKILEFKDANDEERKNTLCNAGIMVINGKYLENFLNKLNNNNASGEYYLTDVVEMAIGGGLQVDFTIAEEDEVMGVNSRNQLAEAEKIFQNKKRKEFMEKGVTLINPDSVYFSYDTEIENDVVVEPNVVFLTGVKVHSNVEIRSFSYLENCEIKSGAIIGPFARIRPNTLINENVHIGDFCEIKKSNIGKGTKINHLSYIGDSTIGENTNIGAGTITCNYDGYSKFKTNIGSNCFIGSNTIFVAPVNVGDDVLTGAGSVITKDVRTKSLAITRGEQKNIDNAMDRYRERKQAIKNNNRS
ncbi:MAG: bifunctional UDP-N-acetylglucosamine diphosphorylase/glucosamine-1-phosphate N-acetyltransferase GlmU [Rickettsiales bacterium]|nr:bifunctional UDP-N-acetylglucosamine diphosphorylase/glucosamine-1-phosphate N-acetyltransferase GlmU [Rickettsiales bacterium]